MQRQNQALSYFWRSCYLMWVRLRRKPGCRLYRYSKKDSSRRVDEAKATGAQAIVAACPPCVTVLRPPTRRAIDGNIRVTSTCSEVHGTKNLTFPCLTRPSRLNYPQDVAILSDKVTASIFTGTKEKISLRSRCQF